ncbi:hypothetical protein VE01_05127 [Pseudogymnoascus verrucosus]|uniref:BZIP domain-containing protein n=1 Tax=Pseudogymnoascus verrucosus TaxID=342668 RepID=A0A1B8GI69_9PEZI|nr:uncharacterized protein VE01_05127 [Pseudogymnoascus verrucosus]OBT95495.2 hypothetical protein VE01_05127 [Pseudogymnoascus verrucosus]
MSPSIKFELSPAESLIEQFEGSSPNESYPSLFDGMNPSEIDGSEYDYADYERFETQTDNDSVTAAANGGDQTQPEKKVVKKRKSWGQQLPEPKTNLPPRKRAKTEDEKEQRRVERVLRNRRAAQSSRERKRQEVEALESEKVAIERRNRDLELRLAEAEARNLALEQQLLRLSSTSPYLSSPSQKAVDASSSPQVTFSQPLFPSGDSAPFTNQQPQTVNPASLSPSIRPVSSTGAESSNARAPDVTQHSAAVLWDLQCPSAAHRPWTPLALLPTLISLTTTLMLPPRPRSPRSSTTSSPSPTASLWTSLISTLLKPTPRSPTSTSTTATATPTSSPTSTSTTSSSPTTTPSTTRPRSSLRSAHLRRLLACSPHLARPLMDATMGAMRSLSERRLAPRVSTDGVVEEGPSMEALAGLLWATRCYARDGGKVRRRSSVQSRVGGSSRVAL